MLALEWKGRAFVEKVNSRCFCWLPAAILVESFCPPIWRLHTKLYKGAWNVSASNSETVGHKDLRFGQIVYILVFYNISFSWLLPLDGLQFIFLCRVYCVTVKTKNSGPGNAGNCILESPILQISRGGMPPDPARSSCPRHSTFAPAAPTVHVRQLNHCIRYFQMLPKTLPQSIKV